MPVTRPDDVELVQYLKGQVSTQRRDLIERWIGEEPAALQILEQLQPGVEPTLVAALRNANDGEKSDFVPHRDMPNSIGNYRLVSQLGEGGMGTIWLAEQRAPVKRTVAIKLIRPGMDSHQVLARFEIERQTLALLDHPNIARVYDGGLTERGLPYFVMELIKGVPLTTYCVTRKLGLRDRLGIFISVCRAVQHAHQKGIIHRDLKPSNILVEHKEGQAVAKIIDFGLAKAMHHKLTDLTLQTQMGMLLGTIEYMSPEQAGASPWDVDTRSDIYSLGVVLYELITGTPPLGKDVVKSKPMDQVLHLVRESDPPLPSSRLSKEGPPSSMMQRDKEVQILRRKVAGDLDCVTMKALEKDPNRRYETASSLAADLERYLKDEPVLANPPSQFYKAKKFIRRNKVAVTAASLVILALSLGSLLAVLGMLQARQAASQAIFEKGRAELAEQEAETQASLAQKAEKQARLSADDAKKQAAKALEGEEAAQRERAKAEQIADALSSLFVATDPVGINGFTSLIRKPLGERLTPIDLLRGMMNTIQFNKEMEAPVKLALLLRIAIAAMNQTEGDLAVQAINQANALVKSHFNDDKQKNAEVLHTAGLINELQGRYREAEQLYRQAMSMRTQLVEHAPPSRRKKFLDDLSVTQLTLCILLSQFEEFQEAEDIGRQGLRHRIELFGSTSKETNIARLYLAVCLVGNVENAKKAEGVVLASQAQQYFEKNDGTKSLVKAATYFQYSIMSEAIGAKDQCLNQLKKSLEFTEQVVGKRHPYYLFVRGQYGCKLCDYQKFDEAYSVLHETLDLAHDLRFLTHPKMIHVMAFFNRTCKALGKRQVAEKRLNLWVEAHQLADPTSQFAIEAMLYTSLHQLTSSDTKSGLERLKNSLQIIEQHPEYLKRAQFKFLLLEQAMIAMEQKDPLRARQIMSSWVPWEVEQGSWANPLKIPNMGFRKAESHLQVMLSWYFLDNPELADRYLNNAISCASDASNWYSIAIQTARLFSPQPSDDQIKRCLNALDKSIQKGLNQYELVTQEPVFEKLKDRQDFKDLMDRLQVNHRKAAKIR